MGDQLDELYSFSGSLPHLYLFYAMALYLQTYLVFVLENKI